jgi:hypothetical protein
MHTGQPVQRRNFPAAVFNNAGMIKFVPVKPT